MISSLRIDCGEFVRAERGREREDMRRAHIRYTVMSRRECEVAGEREYKRERERKKREERRTNVERLKCNELQSKEDDLIYLQKNKAVYRCAARTAR